MNFNALLMDDSGYDDENEISGTIDISWFV
jgi:hypothetical protein